MYYFIKSFYKYISYIYKLIYKCFTYATKS